MMEKSLIIFKPDCLEKKSVGAVLDRFEKAGFAIGASKMTKLSENLLKVHYAHLSDFPFFSEIIAFMRSRPLLIMVLEGEDAVARVRELLGPTDSALAPKGTIRGDLGTDKMRNVVHASDSVENAEKEIERFFSPREVFSATG